MTSRKEQKEALRRERLAREAQADAAARRKRRLGIVAATVLGVAAIVAVLAVAMSGGGDGGGAKASAATYPKASIPKATKVGLTDAARQAGCVVMNPPGEGRTHVTGAVTYKTNPPTSGPHNPVPAGDGIYSSAPPKENYVHTLEHGRVELQFRPGAPAKLRGQLKALFDEDPYHMVLMPNNTGMPYVVAATAWTHLIGCKSVSDKTWDALRAFRDAYRDQAPERIP